MNYVRAITFCAAVAITSGGLFLMASPAIGRPPIIVQAPAEVVVRHISYADLNLAAAPGQQVLKWRVGAAVRDLCDEALGGDNGSTAYKYNRPRCSNDAWAQARPQFDRAVLRAQQLASTGTTTLAATAFTISLPR